MKQNADKIVSTFDTKKSLSKQPFALRIEKCSRNALKTSLSLRFFLRFNIQWWWDVDDYDEREGKIQISRYNRNKELKWNENDSSEDLDLISSQFSTLFFVFLQTHFHLHHRHYYYPHQIKIVFEFRLYLSSIVTEVLKDFLFLIRSNYIFQRHTLTFLFKFISLLLWKTWDFYVDDDFNGKLNRPMEKLNTYEVFKLPRYQIPNQKFRVNWTTFCSFVVFLVLHENEWMFS